MGWELFRRDHDGRFEMVGVDGDLLDDAPVTTLPVAAEIWIEAPSALPEALGRTEAAIDDVSSRVGGRIAGTVRAATQLLTLVYVASDELARPFTELPLPSGASLSIQPSIDPDWRRFDDVRPNGMEVRSMHDLRVMSQLHAHGDRGGVRRIDHIVTGLTDDRVEQFTSAVASLGFAVGERHDDSLHVHNEADPSDITADTWTLSQIAERHGATYDGWGCGIVGGNPTAAGDRSSKRRWWRRGA